MITKIARIPPSMLPNEMIRFLMEQHQFSQSELPEIGGVSVVSEVLSGKRELSVRQIKELSARFRILRKQ